MTTHRVLQKHLEQLAELRSQHRILSAKIRELKRVVKTLGGEPSARRNLSNRNEAMYTAYKEGISYQLLSDRFNLSQHRIKEICKRIDARKC